MTYAEALSEFLLARFAEDEAEVHRTVDYGGGWDGWGDRVLADLKVKRSIISRGERYGHRAVALGEPHHIGWLDNMRDMAMTYDDHPDFREEWRTV